jgi:hypothetical protein
MEVSITISGLSARVEDTDSLWRTGALIVDDSLKAFGVDCGVCNDA